jgi:UPF0042 nucleotide-binding protein
MAKMIILTGMSGAGKTTAILAFETLRYACIDNPPVKLYKSLFELIVKEQNPLPTVVSIHLINLASALTIARAIEGLTIEVICLVASVTELLSRYQLTRHIHPLQGEGFTLNRALDEDQMLVNRHRQDIDMLIDSTGLSAKAFTQKLALRFTNQGKKIVITILSFGFKHGVPMDTEILFDARVITNPYYVSELRQKTGLDADVIKFVQDQKAYQPLLESIQNYVKTFVPSLIEEGRHHYTIAVGCTGGRHRSVVLAQALQIFLEKTFPVEAFVVHRDLAKITEQD